MTLSELKINSLAAIVSIVDRELEMRLIAMGCISGDNISVERKSLFGDPLLIRAGNTLFSIRKEDAAKIIVSKL